MWIKYIPREVRNIFTKLQSKISIATYGKILIYRKKLKNVAGKEPASRTDNTRNKQISMRAKDGVNINQTTKGKELNCCGHVKRMSKARWPQKHMELTSNSKNGKKTDVMEKWNRE